jgi:large subunit ribosomal protein L15
MSDLSNLKPPAGATSDRKRVGRGPGSTLGKTAGRGQKGQKSRSGGSIHPRFEGGQMPLHMRLPKFGFSNAKFRTHFSIVNLQDLEERFEDGETVDEEALRARGLVKGPHDGIKILARGELSKKLSVKATKFSKSARAAIEQAGGSAEVI